MLLYIILYVIVCLLSWLFIQKENMQSEQESLVSVTSPFYFPAAPECFGEQSSDKESGLCPAVRIQRWLESDAQPANGKSQVKMADQPVASKGMSVEQLWLMCNQAREGQAIAGTCAEVLRAVDSGLCRFLRTFRNTNVCQKGLIPEEYPFLRGSLWPCRL